MVRTFWVSCVVGSAVVIGCSSTSSNPVADAGIQDASHPKDSPAEAAPECKGLDAAVQGLTFPAACESCIGMYCCSQGLACAKTSGCKTIAECEANCVAKGTAPTTCAGMCIGADSTADLNAAQNAAYNLDLCLAESCSTYCG